MSNIFSSTRNISCSFMLLIPREVQEQQQSFFYDLWALLAVKKLVSNAMTRQKVWINSDFQSLISDLNELFVKAFKVSRKEFKQKN